MYMYMYIYNSFTSSCWSILQEHVILHATAIDWLSPPECLNYMQATLYMYISASTDSRIRQLSCAECKIWIYYFYLADISGRRFIYYLIFDGGVSTRVNF